MYSVLNVICCEPNKLLDDTRSEPVNYYKTPVKSLN